MIGSLGYVYIYSTPHVSTLPTIPTTTKLGLLDFKVALVAANDPTGQVKYKKSNSGVKNNSLGRSQTKNGSNISSTKWWNQQKWVTSPDFIWDVQWTLEIFWQIWVILSDWANKNSWEKTKQTPNHSWNDFDFFGCLMRHCRFNIFRKKVLSHPWEVVYAIQLMTASRVLWPHGFFQSPAAMQKGSVESSWAFGRLRVTIGDKLRFSDTNPVGMGKL